LLKVLRIIGSSSLKLKFPSITQPMIVICLASASARQPLLTSISMMRMSIEASLMLSRVSHSSSKQTNSNRNFMVIGLSLAGWGAILMRCNTNMRSI
jgi:hypothetical protein